MSMAVRLMSQVKERAHAGAHDGVARAVSKHTMTESSAGTLEQARQEAGGD